MKLSIATLLVGSAAAAASSSSTIKSNSKVGQKLLGKARRLDGEADMSWAANYSLRFEKCATSNEYYGGYNNNNNNDGGDGNGNYNYNGVYEQRLVHFRLCPSDSCKSGCSGGADYVIDMNEFVMSYVEYQQEVMEAKCESVKENCYCDNADDEDACEYQCLMSAGIYDDCAEDDGNNNNNGQQGEAFELQEAIECGRLEVDEDAAQYYNYQNGGNNNNNNNNNNYNYNNGNNNNQQEEAEFFVGPYCSSNGKSIVLGVFMDETCSYAAPTGIYEKYNYGRTLPYSTTSIVSNECISCKQPAEEDENNNNQNNNNYNYNNGNDNYNYNNYNNNNNQEEQEEPEVLEFCENLYEVAGKCESDLSIYGMYPNTMACEFIKGLSGGLKTRIVSTFSYTKNHTPAILASVFAVSTIALASFSYHLHKKTQGQGVGLVHGEGNMA